MLRRTGLALGVGFVLSGAPVAAQPLTIEIPEVARAPEIDNFARAELTQTAGRIEGFRQREPRDGQPATRGTTAFVSYDREHLYVIFVCHDDTSAIRARVTRREQSDADDSVSVYLDTFHDQRRAYVFRSNPVGVQSEGILTEGQDEDSSFDTLWYTESRLTSFGFVVKMTIPFRSLRFTGEPVQTWGFAVSRTIRRLDEDDFWPLVTKRAQAFVPQFAVANGLARINPGANVQMTPYGVMSGGRDEGDSIGERRVGFDTKFGVGSAFVIDATVNPDFSEVESDTPQVTINERFEVLFPERRPFFVENAGYFNTPIPLFFSRRIADPRVGVRMTGKSGPWATGALVTPDRGAPDGASSVAVIGSVRRDLGRDSNVGVLATVRGGEARGNTTMSADGRWTIGKTWAAVGQIIRTQSEAQDSTTPGTGGTGILAEISRSSRHVGLLARYTDLSPNFAAPLGFIRRVNIRQLDQSVSYRFRPNGGPVVKYGPTLDGLVIWDHTRALQDWRLRPRFQVDFIGQTSVRIERSVAFEHYLGLDFDKRRTGLSLESEFSRLVTADVAYEWGSDVNRRTPTGQAPVPAESRTAQASVTWRPGRHVAYTQTYLFTRLTANGSRGAVPIFTDHVVRSRLNVFATRAFSFRGIFDYEHLAANAARTRLRSRQPIGIDLLASYELNPGTALYIGYLNRLEPESLAAQPAFFTPVRSIGHQFFIKTSWLLRY